MLSLALALLVLQPTPGGSAPQGATYRTGPTTVTPYATPSASSEEPTYNIAPAVAPPPPPELARTGVLIDAYDKRVESRWGVDDPFYNGTIRGGAAAAQSRQGPLDGSWRLAGADGAALYALELVEEAGGTSLEGAWREDIAATAGAVTPAKSGFINLIGREPGRTVLRFLEPGAAAPTVITLQPMLDGTWRGELARASAAPHPVTMRRR